MQLVKKKKNVCVWSLISLKLSPCLAISLLLYACPSTSCTWEVCTDVKETRRIVKCLVHSGVTCLTFFFKKKKVA